MANDNGNRNNVFPTLKRELGNYLSDEEGNITRSKIITVGAMALILGMLYTMDTYAKHRSHSSHRSHTSGHGSTHSSHGSAHSSHASGSHESHVSHASHASHSSVVPGISTTTSGGNAAPVTPIVPTAPNKYTPELATNRAYGLYVQNGMNSNDAMSHVQGVLNQIIAQPNAVDSIVQADLLSLQNRATVENLAVNITLEQAVQLAFKMYIDSGFETNAAFARVNAIMPKLALNPANYVAIVNEDIAALKMAVTTGAAASQMSDQQLVQKAYAEFIAQGMNSNEAFAKVQANLNTILSKK